MLDPEDEVLVIPLCSRCVAGMETTPLREGSRLARTSPTRSASSERESPE